MDITPPRGPSFHSYAQSRSLENASSPERAAEAREREAERRIADAEKRIEDSARYAQNSEERIREQHDAEDMRQTQRHEDALIVQKGKYEEEIRKMQNAHQAELNRIRREAENELAQVQDHYNKTLYETERRGKQDLTQIQNRNYQSREYETRNSKDELAELTARNRKQLQEFQANSDNQLAKMTEAAQARLEKVRSQTDEARQVTDARYQERFEKTVAEHDQQINELRQSSTEKLRQMRDETSLKLDAYSSRQKDPFYRMVDLKLEVREESDQYVLSARIPAHERDGVSVTVKGNNVVIAGHRRNEERETESPGHSRVTASYQSFQESVPLKWPIDSKKIERRFEGDRLIVTIPKLNHEGYRPYSARDGAKPPPHVAKIRAEKPDFPENLVVTERRDEDRPLG